MANTVTQLSLIQLIITIAAASLATFLGAFAVEWLKTRSSAKNEKQNYKAQLAIELDQLVKLVSRLRSDYKARHYFALNLLELLAGVILKVEERLKQLTLLDNTDLQQQAFEVISECHLLVIETSGTERYPIDKDITKEEADIRLKNTKENRPEKNIEFSDMQHRLEDIIKELK